MKEADLKKSKMLDMQQQMLVEVEENKVRKEKQAQVAKQNEERIWPWQMPDVKLKFVKKRKLKR